ncbi:hypothetical protein [Dinoroseobacter sp. S375]|uniref:hypothetical protein n=1 Tax=Dinoroseobacter sp. S375 TaxID=3415136 RepID=UPI003C7BBA6E
MTTEDGEIVELGLAVIDGNAVFIPFDPSEFVQPRPDIIQAFRALEGDELQGALALVIEADRPFEHQAFGVWGVGVFDDAGAFSAGSFGAKTRAARLPSGLTARYADRTLSFVVLANGSLLSLESDLGLETDFSTVTLESSGTRDYTGEPSIPSEPRAQYDFSGTGTVSGSGFTADVAGDVLSGQASAFHGPNAEEIGGTYRLTGPTGSTLIGAFGALGDGP